MKQFIGTMYFEPDRDERSKPISRYCGVITGFIVRKDDGAEYEVRDERVAPTNARPLTHSDLQTLKEGDKVARIKGGAHYTVVKVFPVYGDVWIRHSETDLNTAVKFTELRRV